MKEKKVVYELSRRFVKKKKYIVLLYVYFRKKNGFKIYFFRNMKISILY